MSLGATSGEKNQLGQIQSLITGLSNQFSTENQRAASDYTRFQKSLTPALKYWRTLLKGDRTQVEQAIAPEINRIQQGETGRLESLTQTAPRSGVTASGVLASQQATQGAVNNAILSARPEAAQQLQSIAGLAGGMSTAESGLGLSAAGSAMQGGFGALNVLDQWRQQENQFWGSLGGAIAGLALGGLGGAFGAGGAGGFGGFLSGMLGHPGGFGH